MNWLLIITIFSASGSTTVSYTYPTEDVCERAASNYMELYAEEGVTAKYKCESDVAEFVVPKK